MWMPSARQAVLAGHLLECAGQVTGGYFADPGYKDVPDLWKLGFPLIEIDETGAFTVTKVEGSGGLVSVDTCKEQMIYEIHNPKAYLTPDAAVLVGMLMLGNLMKECGVVDRIQKTAGNELMNIITIFLALSVGCTTSANTFLNSRTLFIIVLGLIAFSFGTAAGVLCGKVMYILTGGQVNPLIGSAGVSAVPMAARVSQKVGQSENPSNFLLMHAMGPNVAGVIGSAVAAGILINIFG